MTISNEEIKPYLVMLLMSPIAIILLSIFGVFVLGSVILKIVDVGIIAISLLITFILWKTKKQSIVSVLTLSALLGVIYWALQISIFQATNPLGGVCRVPLLGQLICGVGTVIVIPDLIANILSFMLWLSLFGIFIRKK